MIVPGDKRKFSVPMILRVVLLLVAVHSVALGSTIYLFTTPFYQFFFSVDPDNFFFIKQAGVFLFLMGFFYFLPVVDMERYNSTIYLVIFTKVVAVAFLLVNANLSLDPTMIYLAALGDAFMAFTIVSLLLLRLRA